MQSIICPNCKKPMASLIAHSKYEAHIEIDQCPECGGLWFDGTELYMIKEGLAAVIDKVDRVKLRALIPTVAELRCPKDDAVLKIFKDRSFPESIQIEYCPTCLGFWFNRGEFNGWQTIREQKAATPPSASDKKFDQDIDSLLALYGSQDESNALGRLGNFMAAAYGLPDKMVPLKDEPSVETSAQIITVAHNLLGLLKQSSSDQKIPQEEERLDVLAKARLLNFAIKIFAVLLTIYFIVSEISTLLDQKIIYTQLDLSIWYFRMLMALFVLPILYIFKFINYVQTRYMPTVRTGSVNSTFLQARLFYYTIYGILFLLLLAKSFNW